MLLTLAIMPLLGALLLLIPSPKLTKNAFQVGLIVSVLTWILSCWIYLSYNQAIQGFQMVQELPWLDAWNISIRLGIDGLSLTMVLLTTILFPICILASWEAITFQRREFIISMLIILSSLIFVFLVLDLLLFYVFFEAVLIPMFLIIGIWGSRTEKVQAAYYFVFYTLVGSLILLAGIVYMYTQVGSTDYLANLTHTWSETEQRYLWLAFFASLAVKIPMFPAHIWLPQAHVEAPVAGSVLLAGIMLKLGGYGFIRFSLALFPDASIYFQPLIWTLSILAIIWGSLTTLRQNDIKRLIAYSSVAHMGVVTLGIFTNAVPGAVYLMVAHGIVSGGLFLTVGMLYDRYHSRLIPYYGGLTTIMPLLSSAVFILTLANCAVPLTCNFIGEFLILTALYAANPILAILTGFSVIVSAGYSLFLYNRLYFGRLSPHLVGSVRDISRREFHVLAPVLFGTIFFGIVASPLLNLL